MTIEETLNQILPPIGTKYMHITSQFGEERPNHKTHMGVDFNYIGGQTGINLTHPKIHSPVNGKVTFVGGQFGTIKICDKQGYSHELLHLHTQRVKVGDIVMLGEEIGTMGGKGPLGHFQYPQHVHYQVKNTIGKIENPNIWWKNQLPLESTCSEKNAEMQVAIKSENLTDAKEIKGEKLVYHEILTATSKDQMMFHDTNIELLNKNILSDQSLTALQNEYVF